mmetsp:Transcript_26061/g.43949  ORF Transcript_26061/g.43949 Transcript_26061/m.43949 type:complete len:231 (-) Transcript_26061:5383-6075(-)
MRAVCLHHLCGRSSHLVSGGLLLAVKLLPLVLLRLLQLRRSRLDLQRRHVIALGNLQLESLSLTLHLVDLLLQEILQVCFHLPDLDSRLRLQSFTVIAKIQPAREQLLTLHAHLASEVPVVLLGHVLQGRREVRADIFTSGAELHLETLLGKTHPALRQCSGGRVHIHVTELLLQLLLHVLFLLLPVHRLTHSLLGLLDLQLTHSLRVLLHLLPGVISGERASKLLPRSS